MLSLQRWLRDIRTAEEEAEEEEEEEEIEGGN
jgi:hypothetical protein